MNLWILYYSGLDWTNLKNALDKIIADSSKTYSNSVSRLQQVYIKVDSNSFEVNSYVFGRRFLTNVAVNTTYLCLVSPNLSIRCRITRLRNQDPEFSLFEIELKLPAAQSAYNTVFSFRYFNASEFLNTKNG